MAVDPQRGQEQKRGFRAFLTPGWILSAVFVLLFTYFAFNTLAPWQLGKNTKRTEFNDRLKAAMEQAPVPVSEVLPAEPAKPVEEAQEWRHVTLQGKLLPQQEVLLRNRPVESAPAYQVITPFETTDGTTVLVNRGWVPAESGDNRPELIAKAPAGEMELTGYVRLGEGKNDRGVIDAEGAKQTTRVNAEQIGAATGLTLAHDYVQLDEQSTEAITDRAGDAGVAPHPIPLPKIESGPYLSYGIQWIAFGIIAPILLGWFIWSEIKERRREQLENEQLATVDAGAGAGPNPGEAAAVGAAGTGGDQATESNAAAGDVLTEPSRETQRQEAQRQEDAMAARYGKAAKRRGFGWNQPGDGERF
ncbi:SURF1 family protein [Corynebacterium urealyticum]|uniref:SURF1-like protein n=1 Tax=Corynebacterium urealyticum TaxID=43771 RepID=A0A5D4FV18_9CORY|nr:SURF1 family protein [Corynebacterium urealyticum]TYR20381.1 SURF1 family protein [Corynebacterium urealyticum]